MAYKLQIHGQPQPATEVATKVVLTHEPAIPGVDPGGTLSPPWKVSIGDGPVVASAIHAGHEVRADVAAWLAVGESDRWREEDPLTSIWTSIGDTSIQVFRSRFEIDLNRPRHKAVAVDANDAWGLQVWREPLPDAVLDRSLREYDDFYRSMAMLFGQLTGTWHSILVLDLHSYNHRRGGPGKPEDNFTQNPEINIGTGSMDRLRWAPLVDQFTSALREQTFLNRQLDVRENVKFQGGFFPCWLHETFPENVCVLAVEMKKIFMDEWSGVASINALEDLRIALRNATNAVRPELARRR